MRFLLPDWAFGEMSKLPALYQHYQIHKAQNAEISFVDFLALHYGASFAQHSGDHSHSNLPMKDHHHHTGGCCASPIVLIGPPAPLPLPHLVSDSDRAVFSDKNFHPSLHLKDIFQPPRQA